MANFSMSDVRRAVEASQGETTEFLCDLIRFPSLPGEEQGVVEFTAQRFAEVGDVEHIPLADALRGDRDYAYAQPGLTYYGRSNLRVRVAGSGGGRSLLLNTHLDVVPPSPGQEHPFEPKVEAGRVYGRGACDAKGQVAALFAALLAVKHLGMTLRGDVLVHLVVEEEVGGNGTLALVRRGEQADACIVMEPTTDLGILTSVRGSVWFRVTCAGESGHSGDLTETRSALQMAIRASEILGGYRDRLFAASQDIPLFDQCANSMPILFGKLTAGNWLAAVPAEAVLEGVLGFLPNKTRHEVMQGVRQSLREEGDEWFRNHVAVDFPNRHDAHVLDPGHPLVTCLQRCCREAGARGQVGAMAASCDSWLYHNQLRIPTVVFGPGSLRFGHRRDEQIGLDEIREAAIILVRFLAAWCA